MYEVLGTVAVEVNSISFSGGMQSHVDGSDDIRRKHGCRPAGN